MTLLRAALCVLAWSGSAAIAQPEPPAGPMIRPSGLRPVFPADVHCPPIASPFGSRTRYDGSPRPTWSFGGYHGGIDISLPEGTALLALAAGTVASKGEGGQLEGIYLWLRHAPEDTGLGYWLYSKYQHLESASELEVGAKVSLAQVVGRSGKTGTTGMHYGADGYPHLHLTTLKGVSGDLIVGSRGKVPGALIIDPLVAYRDAGRAAGDEVTIPYVAGDGGVRPKGSRLVWPVACRAAK